jgi:hypothetical protein
VDTPKDLDDPADGRMPHVAHLFSGWMSFLEHLQNAHGIDPPEDDQEATSDPP